MSERKAWMRVSATGLAALAASSGVAEPQRVPEESDVLAVGVARADDAAARAGDRFPGFDGPTVYPVGNAPRAIIACDLNGDGHIDLAAADNASEEISILFGNGDGTFQPNAPIPLGAGPWDLVAEDLNGDGAVDLAVADAGLGGVFILLGDGAGGFTTTQFIGAGTGTTDIAAADLDNDGNMDLVASNVFSDTVSVFFNSGDGLFGAPANYPSLGQSPTALALGDLNEDGAVDIVVANSQGDNYVIRWNDGQGGFSRSSEFQFGSPRAVRVFDIDQDGDLDLIVAGSLTLDFRINHGAGLLIPQPGIPSGVSGFSSFDFADFNLDGVYDIVANRNSVINGGLEQARVFLGVEDQVFVHPADLFQNGVIDGSDLSIFLLAWGFMDAQQDFNADQIVNGQDLAWMLANWGAVPIYDAWSWNFGTNTFLEDVATGDFDGDGDADFAVANQDASIWVFLNRQISP